MRPTVPRTTELELAEADAINDFLVTTYGTGMRTRGGDRRPLFYHRRTDTGTFALEVVKLYDQFHLVSEPLRAIVITRSVTARIERRCGPADGRYDAGDLFLTSDPYVAHTATWSGDVVNCVIDASLLGRVAAPAPGRRTRPIRFTDLDPRSPAKAAHWWATRCYASTLLANPDAAAAPLLLDSAAQLLAAATLATFPNTAVTEPTIEDRHDATGTTLRRAVAYIDENASDHVSLADIADAAHVSIRTVQLAFRRHLDTTPMAHLRRVRLDHAHRELAAADPRHTTVTGVAARWGFASHSRFTASYRAAYGVAPSTTLRA